MRSGFPLLVALLVTYSTAAYADPYQWVGVTSVAYGGIPNDTGFVGLTTQCRADFGPRARMCESQEILRSTTLNIEEIPAGGCWVRPSIRAGFAPAYNQFTPSGIIDASGVVGLSYDQTCNFWKFTQESNYGGLVLGAGGTFDLDQCSVARPVACCRPASGPPPRHPAHR